jgi:hypothetical protein
MQIPVLTTLENRTDWIRFLRKERPYAYVREPLCLVDLQSTYLQITLLTKDQLDGRSAIKYSIGSKHSIEPTWRLIKGCNWHLSTLIDGLETLRFDSNVRDNSFLKAHSDITVRRFFAKEKALFNPERIGLVTPVTIRPNEWSLDDVIRLISHDQFKFAVCVLSPKTAPPIKHVLLRLLESHEGWTLECIQMDDEEDIILSFKGKPILQLTPDIKKPAPRLA